MKKLYTFPVAVFLTASPLFSQQVITSVANGNATSPLTWSCNCIPMDGDTITINHNVTLDVDYAFTMGGIHINTGGQVNGNAGNRIFGVSGGYFVNDGSLSMGYIAHNGGTFTNNNTMNVSGSLLIDQGVTTVNNSFLIVGDSSYINTGSTLQNNGTFTGGICLSAGSIFNMYNFSAEIFMNTGTMTSNGTGTTNISYDLYNTGNITLNTWTHVQGNVWNAENITVSNYLLSQSLYNGDSTGTATFLNNGTVSLSNSLINSQTLNGSGDFCVTDSTINGGFVNGTLDICDQSGGGWDVNFGTEQGTVTHCAAGPCTIGIAETLNTTIGVSPNPSNEFIRLQLPTAEVGVVEVMDMTGRVVLREDIAGKEILLNILLLPEGLYAVTVRGQQQNYYGRFIKD